MCKKCYSPMTFVRYGICGIRVLFFERGKRETFNSPSISSLKNASFCSAEVGLL
jgi:hypothetical protein